MKNGVWKLSIFMGATGVLLFLGATLSSALVLALVSIALFTTTELFCEKILDAKKVQNESAYEKEWGGLSKLVILTVIANLIFVYVIPLPLHIALSVVGCMLLPQIIAILRWRKFL